MMNPKYPVDRAVAAPLVKEALQGWRATAVAAAAAAALCWPVQAAHALTLGRITVLSALGEPLLAEIELPDITAAESASLQASIATPAAFRAAGLEYNAALQGVRITQQRQANGRPVLRLTSERPATAPFVDVILQVNWASGRAVRDYTILLDPPAAQRQSAPATATAPQVAPGIASTPSSPSATPPQPVVAPPAAPPAASAPSASPAPAPAAAVAPAPEARPAPAPARPPVAAPAPAASTAGGTGRVAVRPGDTASKIASAVKPARISLDQMLVAMLRSNPEAFIQGNVNRLKAGSVLDLPTADQAASVPAPEASRMVTAQSRDFNAFRTRLAGNVPAQAGAAERSASGRVQTQVDENRPTAAAPDRLTLSKGGLQARAAEERIAREKATAQADERVAELSRNISDLNRLGATTPASAPATNPATEAAAKGEATAGITAPAAQSPTPQASAPAAAPAPAAVQPSPAAMPRPAVDQPGWLTALLANPLVPAGAAALIALLVALGLYRARQRRKEASEDPILTGRSQPDSFFGNSGGQSIDTAETTAVAASAAPTPSQLHAAGDVDPIAEADVYLAYGRDLQAEEILKEALRTEPTRAAVHAKLAEIYAKRRDSTAFLAIATQAQTLTAGSGPEWAQIAALGRELVPADPRWAATPDMPSATSIAAAGAIASASLASAALTRAPAAPPQPAPAPMDFDLDLDLDLDSIKRAAPSWNAELPAGTAAPALGDAQVDPAHASSDLAAPPEADALDFDLDLEPDEEQASPSAAAALQSRSAGADALAFDLGSLNLDLGDDSADIPAAATPAPDAGLDDPLATKLALAEEFEAIGDADGARALAEEVLAEASGPLKTQAQRFLADLG